MQLSPQKDVIHYSEGFWEGGRMRSTGNLSPSRWQCLWLSDVTVLELWSLLGACNFEGMAWLINCD